METQAAALFWGFGHDMSLSGAGFSHSFAPTLLLRCERPPKPNSTNWWASRRWHTPQGVTPARWQSDSSHAGTKPLSVLRGLCLICCAKIETRERIRRKVRARAYFVFLIISIFGALQRRRCCRTALAPCIGNEWELHAVSIRASTSKRFRGKKKHYTHWKINICSLAHSNMSLLLNAD